MIEVNIDARKLQAIALFAADSKDLRYYLHGVHVEATPTVTRIAATNGHYAAMLSNANPLDSNAVPETHDVTFIIPLDVIAKIKLSKTVQNIVTVLIESKPLRDDDTKIENLYTLRLWDGTRIPFTPCDGIFPAIRRVTPVGPASGEACNFDADLLSVFSKANKLMTMTREPGCFEIGFRGEGRGITIKLPEVPEFVGILMPRRKIGDNPLMTCHEVQPWPAFNEPVKEAA